MMSGYHTVCTFTTKKGKKDKMKEPQLSILYIRRWLKRFGLSVAELSRKVGCTRHHLQKVLTGQNIPSVTMAERILQSINKSIEEEKDFMDLVFSLSPEEFVQLVKDESSSHS